MPDPIPGYAHGNIASTESGRMATVVCRTCGAAVLLHPEIDTPALHTAYHEAQGLTSGA